MVYQQSNTRGARLVQSYMNVANSLGQTDGTLVIVGYETHGVEIGRKNSRLF